MKAIQLVCATLALMAATAFAAPAPPPVILTPPASARVLTPAYFGIHVHNTGPVRHWPDIAVGSIRLWDSRVAWPNLEPQSGRWDF